MAASRSHEPPLPAPGPLALLPIEPGETPAPTPHMGALPKPRALAPVENPLRRRERAVPSMPRSEDEILEALTALAGGR
jgi:hypothetical protein